MQQTINITTYMYYNLYKYKLFYSQTTCPLALVFVYFELFNLADLVVFTLLVWLNSLQIMIINLANLSHYYGLSYSWVVYELFHFQSIQWVCIIRIYEFFTLQFKLWALYWSPWSATLHNLHNICTAFV